MPSDLKAAVKAVNWTDPETGLRTSDVEAAGDGKDTMIRGQLYDDKWRLAGRFRFRLVGKNG